MKKYFLLETFAKGDLFKSFKVTFHFFCLEIENAWEPEVPEENPWEPEDIFNNNEGNCSLNNNHH